MPELSPIFLRQYLPRVGSGGVTFSFLLDDEGKVVTCDVLTDGVTADQEAKLCARTLGETAGQPATGPDGEAVHGYVSGSIISSRRGWSAGPRNAAAAGKYLTLNVSALPDGARSAQVQMLAYFDASGKVAECRPSPGGAGPLFDVACSQSKQITFPTIKGSGGKSVGHVDDLTVIFEVDAG